MKWILCPSDFLNVLVLFNLSPLLIIRASGWFSSDSPWFLNSKISRTIRRKYFLMVLLELRTLQGWRKLFPFLLVVVFYVASSISRLTLGIGFLNQNATLALCSLHFMDWVHAYNFIVPFFLAHWIFLLLSGFRKRCLEGVHWVAIKRHGEIVQVHDQTRTTLESCISQYLSPMDTQLLPSRHGCLLCQVCSFAVLLLLTRLPSVFVTRYFE